MLNKELKNSVQNCLQIAQYA